ncbi:copper amine oxidase N-terminal domain-containing protein [Paenibacillus turpanensis]|uniref:copper amine oxidase N-terminal domain-containing protein n=1 Tax=Paenibacillus turpanensis TaxID=2689078 RepID=UPI001409D89C|nr:copper amine oxidase N-terminal domain-containing protein [Paenibacillus turpanensis]
MHRFQLRKMLLSASASLLLATSIGPAPLYAAPESVQLFLYPDSKTVYVNGEERQAEAAMITKDKRHYLPAAQLAEWLGTPVAWNAEKGAVQITASQAYLEFYPREQKVLVNGNPVAWEDAALFEQDRLFIDVEWLKQYVGLHSRYDEKLQRLELRYIQTGDGQLFRSDTLPNAAPVANFAIAKDSYRIGEPIHYNNLSYDPKGNALSTIDWGGAAEAIFTPGLYKVWLQVRDTEENSSINFDRNIWIRNEPYLDAFDYNVYHKPVGSFVTEQESVLRSRLRGLPQLEKKTEVVKDRPLLVSDSPEIFTKRGVLYEGVVNGKARLYADHINGTDRKMQFAIAVRNPHSDRSVTITTTNKGEVFPSKYAMLIGNEATIEFLQGEKKPETLVVGPGETVYYKVMPGFYPEQGMNVIYDVETDGDAQFMFLAMEPGDTLETVQYYPKLPYDSNVRGTFIGSEVNWEIRAGGVREPSSFAIGDGTTDVFLPGTDEMQKMDSVNYGNYGVVYNIKVRTPPKMAVLILARGGHFLGPFTVNGKIVQAPSSGIMTAYGGYTILTRTTGTEPMLDLSFSPAAGSAFPIDVIFYPLKDLE